MALFQWARADETPRKVVWHFTKDLDAIALRVATAADEISHPERVFAVTELGDLWLTLATSGFNLKTSNIFLTGKELGADGKPLTIPAEVTVVSKKNGKTYGYSYTEKQIKAFGVPQNLHLMSGFKGKPVLIVGQLPYVKKSGSGGRVTPTVQRMTATPVAPAEPAVQRKRA